MSASPTDGEEEGVQTDIPLCRNRLQDPHPDGLDRDCRRELGGTADLQRVPTHAEPRGGCGRAWGVPGDSAGPHPAPTDLSSAAPSCSPAPALPGSSSGCQSTGQPCPASPPPCLGQRWGLRAHLFLSPCSCQGPPVALREWDRAVHMDPRNEDQQAGASPPSSDPRVGGMPSPAEPVKPVSQPSRASRSEMYSLWSRDGAVRGGCGQGAGPRGCGGLPPYHVGIRGGHDVGVDAVGPHDAPQRGQTRRRVGGRPGQVLVAQGDVLGLGGTPCRGSQEQGGGARRGSPVGPRSNPGCHSWWKEPVVPALRHSLWARRHPGASGCSLGDCWTFAPARNCTRQL